MMFNAEIDLAAIVSTASEIVAMLPVSSELRDLVIGEVIAQCEDRERRLASQYYAKPSTKACILADANSSPGTG